MMLSQLKHTKLAIIDDLAPEDSAMIQALYSRSAESVEVHLEKVKKSGSGKFMSSYYVGYGHKSIADCGSTTMFIENVSLLAAKAFQDWPLYSGQETSTRYIDMSKQHIVDPVGSPKSGRIMANWMSFYTDNQAEVAETIRARHPMRESEDPKQYAGAVKARTFDILRGFLPAGITTQFSWHSNIRQAGDHLVLLCQHPSEEIRDVAKELRKMLGAQYPSSGGGLSLPSIAGVELGKQEDQTKRQIWEALVGHMYTYPKAKDVPWDDSVHTWSTPDMADRISEYNVLLKVRPRGCILPHFMSDLGQIRSTFLLDFGSFRDIQRHRNGVCRMPLLTTGYGFEPWYIDQLSSDLRDKAKRLISEQAEKINELTDDPVVRQYYTALGFRVATSVTYGLPASVYVMELRSGKTVHPTLRKKVHSMVHEFQHRFPEVPLHVDMDADDWDVRRGTQTITEK